MATKEGKTYRAAIKEIKGIKTPKRDKKWQIVQAAAALFIKKGTVNTGVRDIAEASGITVGTLYHYFRSKEDIISAFMDYAVAGTERFYAESEKLLEHTEPMKALKLAIDGYFKYTDDAQNVILFWHQETRNLSVELRNRLLDNECVLLSIFQRILEKGRDRKVFKIKNVRLAAHNIIVMADMWSFRRWDLKHHITAEQYRKEQTGFILHGLCDGTFDSSK
jgi:TetR/AcrR family transcriptional regulator, cholesterol catabolism regulator